MYKMEIFVPVTHFEKIREALREADAGHVGNYDSALSYSPVIGTWRTLEGADPYNGVVGEVTEAEEYKVEVIVKDENLERTYQSVRRAHPYEVPVINVIRLVTMEEFD